MAKVLIIDDSGLARKMVRMTLESSKHDVVDAASAEEGLEKVDSEKPNIIVTDLNMPGMSGIDFLKKVRPLRIPIIMLTADIQEDTKKECMANGAVAFLNKPPTQEALDEAITSNGKTGI